MPIRVPRLPRPALPAASLLALLAAACADPPPPAATPPAAAPRPAPVPPRPAGPVTAFDGTYSGVITLNPDRTRRCAEAPAEPLQIVVRQGRGSFLVNPTTRQVLSGTVGEDGSIRMVDIVDRSIATSGVFTPRGFVGEHRNGLCVYAVNLRREG
jgi:hypothetical protein